MKKIINSLLGLLGMLNFVVGQAPSASGNVMNFSSVSAYEPYTEDENTWSSLRAIAEQSSTLTTLTEASVNDVDTLYPEFLFAVLNTDYIFQIGSYLIKIDLLNDRGLVIAAGNPNAYSELVNNNLSASGMMILDGEEESGLELLEALANGSTTSAEYHDYLIANRACRGARREKLARIEQWTQTLEECDEAPTVGRTYGMDNKVVYQKAIFYFSLQSKIRSVWRCTYGGSWTLAPIYLYVDEQLIGTVKYRRRCNSEVNNSVSLEEGYFGGGDGILHWRAYSGGRSLSHYDFNVDFGIRPAQDRIPNPPPYFPSGHYRIVSGY